MHLITGSVPGTNTTQTFIVDSVSNTALPLPAFDSEGKANDFLKYFSEVTSGEDIRRLSAETLYNHYYRFTYLGDRIISQGR